jgi:2-isopropylmalate synthase
MLTLYQDGLIKEKTTYEIMTPQSVGVPETHIVLGKHSGRHAIHEHIKKMGYTLTGADVGRVFTRFKELSDVKKDIFDEDLEAILYDEVFRVNDKYSLIYINVVSGNVAIPTATLKMNVGEKIVQEAGFGVGPVDATFSAIRRITETKYPLLEYNVKAVTGGTDALGEVTVRLQYNGRSVVGRGAHPDIIVASANAYINALNRLEWLKSNIRSIDIR